MTKLKIIILFFFALAIAIYWRIIMPDSAVYNPKEELSFDGMNAIRVENHVPVIERNWRIVYSHSGWKEWALTQRGLHSDSPFHVNKIVFFSDSMAVKEEDAFHFNFSDTLDFRLIIESSYTGSKRIERTRNKLIRYYKNNYPPTSSSWISNAKADSILQAWKIPIP